MANLTESATWEATINEIATTDPVTGGPSGPANVQATQLANRTKFLKGQVDSLNAAETVAAHEAKSDPHTQYLLRTDGGANPVGTVISGYFASIPAGYLELGGALISRATYSNLWAHVQTLVALDPSILITDSAWLGSTTNNGLFSSGDGSTDFRLPNLRDWFIRAKVIGRALGSSQSGTGFDYSVTGSIEARPKNIALLFCIKY